MTETLKANHLPEGVEKEGLESSLALLEGEMKEMKRLQIEAIQEKADHSTLDYNMDRKQVVIDDLRRRLKGEGFMGTEI